MAATRSRGPASTWIPTQESALLRYLDTLDTECTRTMDQRKIRWKKNILLYRTGLPDRTDGPPLFHANLVRPLIRRQIALMTEQKPRIEIRPHREGLGKTAELLTDIINAQWDDQGVSSQLEDAAQYVGLMESSFWQLSYDPAAKYGLGSISHTAIDPRMVGVDPAVMHARDLNAASYITCRTVVPLYIVEQAYPEDAHRLCVTDRITSTDEEIMGGEQKIRGPIEKLLRRQRGVTPGESAIPRCELVQYWMQNPAVDEDGVPLYPNGQVVIRNERTILNHDAEGRLGQQNPYYDGLWPLEWLDSGPDVDSAWGQNDLDLFRHVLACFNRLGNVATRTTLLNAIPFIIVDQNTLLTETVNTLRKLGFVVIEKSPGRTVERPPANVQIGSIQQLMSFFMSLTEYLCGLQDAGGGVGGKGRVEVRSPALLEGLQQAQLILVRAEARRFEYFLERLGQKWISRNFQFVTSDELLTTVASDQTIRTVQFERKKLLEEIVALATTRLEQARREADRPPDATDDPETRGQYGGILSFGRPDLRVPRRDTPTLDTADMLEAIKGAWRLFRFMVVPFSSLSSTRQLKANQELALAERGYMPSRIPLGTLGYDNPKELTQEAAIEHAERTALGIAPAPTPTGKSSTKKKK